MTNPFANINGGAADNAAPQTPVETPEVAANPFTGLLDTPPVEGQPVEEQAEAPQTEEEVPQGLWDTIWAELNKLGPQQADNFMRWFNTNKAKLSEISGLPAANESQLLAWILWKIVAEGFQYFAENGLPVPDVSFPNIEDMGETLITASLFLPILNRVYPKKIRYGLMAWAAVKIFGRSGVYALFNLEGGSFTKAAVDFVFTLAEDTYPPALVTTLLRDMFGDTSETDYKLPLGTVLQDKFGNEYEVISGDNIKQLNDSINGKAGDTYPFYYELKRNQYFFWGKYGKVLGIYFTLTVKERGTGETPPIQTAEATGKEATSERDISKETAAGTEPVTDYATNQIQGLLDKARNKRDETQLLNRGGMAMPQGLLSPRPKMMVRKGLIR